MQLSVAGRSAMPMAAAGGQPSMVSSGAMILLPATYSAGVLSAPAMAAPPKLLWKHDNYIYADFQLLQQFGANFLSDQQNKLYIPYVGTLPVALEQALATNSDVVLATGEYGSISMDIVHYTQRYNDPALSSIAGVLKGLSFQPLPASSHTLQLKYTYPFCNGCSLGSVVPEAFNFGVVLQKSQTMQMIQR
jgi:hypothetical protein